MQIYKAMVDIMRKVSHISKGQKNQQQGFTFRGIDDVMNELHSVMADAGVFLIPKIKGNWEIVEKQTKSGGALFYTRQAWEFHFCAEDGSFVVAEAIGEAMDSGDKGMNKSMSIALKYALLQTFLIPTEDDKDPDANTHDLKSAFITADQAKTLSAMIELSETDSARFLGYFKIGAVAQLPVSRFDEAIKMLNAKLDNKAKEGEK
jgi:hypothetical protein